MSVLFSIKPEYAEKIFDGSKRYEFRKAVFKREGISEAFVYSSSPTKKIIGKIRMGPILEGTPETIWRRCSKYSGIRRSEFFAYFKGKDRAYAITIKRVERLAKPVDPRTLIRNFAPPQSFYYLNEKLMNRLQ